MCIHPHAGSATLKYPATPAMHIMYKNSIITEQVIHTTIHVDFGAGVVAAVQDIHGGSLSTTLNSC